MLKYKIDLFTAEFVSENAVGTRHVLKASGFAVQYLILLALSPSELTQPSTWLAGLLLKTLLAERCPTLKSGNAPPSHLERKKLCTDSCITSYFNNKLCCQINFSIP